MNAAMTTKPKPPREKAAAELKSIGLGFCVFGLLVSLMTVALSCLYGPETDQSRSDMFAAVGAACVVGLEAVGLGFLIAGKRAETARSDA